MAFVDDFIANLGRDFRQLLNQTASNTNSVVSGIAGTLLGNGLSPSQLILALEQAAAGFIFGDTLNNFPGRVNAFTGFLVAVAPLAAYTASFGEVNVGFILFEAGLAATGSGILATAGVVVIPIVVGNFFATVAQAYAETLETYSNGGAGYQLANPGEMAGFALIGLQYDADLALAGTPNPNAVSSIITPGAVLTINLDPKLWTSTYGGNPPDGYGANDISGRTVLIQGILGGLEGTDGSEFVPMIQGSLDPYVTEILVANVTGVPISDSGVAPAYGKNYGEAFILGNTAGSILTPSGKTFDAFIAQGHSNTIDFTGSSATAAGANLVELVNGGTLAIQAADRTDCTIVWDASGTGTVAINCAENTNVKVIEVDIPDVSKANFLALDASQLDGLFGPAIVIVNPTSAEHIVFNGVQLSTPAVIDVPNAAYDPSIRNAGEPNPNLTPYFEHWQAGGLEYGAGYTDSQPGDSYVYVSKVDDINAPTLTLYGFNNTDFGFSVPSSSTAFNIFTGAKISLPTVMNGHAEEQAKDYLTYESPPQGNTKGSPTGFGGDKSGTVDPHQGVVSVSGTITAFNTYSWLASFVPLSSDDVDAPDGMFSFDSLTGDWSFTLDLSSSHYLALAPWVTANDTIDVHTLDGSSATITITVVGGGASDTVDQFLADEGQIDQLDIAVTVSDTAANIAAALDALNADTHVTQITLAGSGPPTLTLTAAQAVGDTRALGLVTPQTYQIAIVDTYANVAAALPQLAANAHVASIAFTDAGTPVITLSASDALAVQHALSLVTSPHTLTIADSAAHISALTPAQIATLAADGLTKLVVTDVRVNPSAAQLQAIGAAGITFIEPYPYAGASQMVLTYFPSGTLREAIYTGVTGQSYDKVDSVYYATGTIETTTWSRAGVAVQDQTWNAAGQVIQRRYYSANGQVETVSYVNGLQSEILDTNIPGQPWDRNDTLYNTATGKATIETWTTAGALYRTETWNADGSVHDVHLYVAGQTSGAPYTDYDVLYGTDGKESVRTYYANGVAGEVITSTYDSAGTLREALYTHLPNASIDTTDLLYAASGKLATLTSSKGGALVFEQDYRSDGTVADRLYGPTASYSLLEYDYDAAGNAQILKNQTNLDGTHTISGLADGGTLTSTPQINDTLIGGGAGETFVFGAGFGHDTVTDLASHLSGLGADTLQFQASSFSYLTAGMTEAQEVAALLAHATQDGSGAAVITDSGGDSVALKGVSLAQLTANAGVIKVL